MSRHVAWVDEDHSDSGLDISHSHHRAAHDDYEETHAVAASSLVEPWSQYNTRLQPDYPASPRANPEWAEYHHSYYPASAVWTNHSIPTLDASFDPVVHSASPDTQAFSTYVPSASSSLTKSLLTNASAASVASRLDRHDGIASCSDCGQEFTGTYRAGNLSRHRKQKHLDVKENVYQCTFPGCPSVFSRSDARLKHARIKHPGLHLPPAQRRRDAAYDSVSPSANNDDSVWKGLELPPQQQQLQTTQRQTQVTVRDNMTLARSSAQDPSQASSIRTLTYSQPPHLHTSSGADSVMRNMVTPQGGLDTAFLSPYPPLSYRRTSLPSTVRLDAPRLSRASSSRRSLPDDPDDYIDPSLLNPSLDDISSDSVDYHFFSPRNAY